MSTQPLISVIDDDEGIRESLDGLIRSLGLRVRVFDSAESFLAAGIHDQTGCIVSDVQMPGMSGIDLLRTMRATNCRIPVILMSAFVSEQSFAEARSAGAYCTFRKPFDGEALVSCIEKALKD
ncbi:response regulator [Sphingomonas sp. DT-51]